MVEFLEALIQIKTPLALLGFMGVILLAAFKTKRVPEELFKLLHAKLTRERFCQLLNRAFAFGLVSFVLVCALAAIGLFVSTTAQVTFVSPEKHADELKSAGVPAEKSREAETAYEQGAKLYESGEILRAIEELKRSVDLAPTLSAQLTITYLYSLAGDMNAAQEWGRSARQRAKAMGEILSLIAVDRFLTQDEEPKPTESQSDCDHSLVGNSRILPQGGDSFENAVTLKQGRYRMEDGINQDVYAYYRLSLREGEILYVEFRTPDRQHAYAGARVYDHNGSILAENTIIGDASTVRGVSVQATYTGIYFVGIGNPYDWNAAGSVYNVCVEH